MRSLVYTATLLLLSTPATTRGDETHIAELNRVYSQGVTADNNAVVPLVRAFGPTAVDREHREATYKALGIDALPECGDYFVTFDDFVDELVEQEYEVWLETQVRDAAASPSNDSKYADWEKISIRKRIADRLRAETRGPWFSRDCPQVAAWLNRSEAHLASLAEAGRRSRWYTPFVGMEPPDRTWMHFRYWSSVDRRMAAQAITALSMRSRLHLGEGRTDAACRDAIAAMQLAEVQIGGRSLCNLYDAPSVAALGALEFVLEEVALTSDQAKRMLADLGDERNLPTLAEAIGPEEKLSLTATLPYLAKYGISATWRDAKDPAVLAPSLLSQCEASILHVFIDWEEAAAMIEEYRRSLRRAVAQDSYVKRKAAVEKLIPPSDRSFFDGPHREMLVFLEQLGPAFFDPITRRRLLTRRLARQVIEDHVFDLCAHLVIFEFYETVLWSRRAARIGLALAAWRADHGDFPAALDSLAPGYLPAVPLDPYTNRALRYRREGAGYLIYSVGANGKDDGARASWEKGKCKSEEPPEDADDIFLRVSGAAYPP